MVMKIAAAKPEGEMRIEVRKAERRKVGTTKRNSRSAEKDRTRFSK